MEHYLAVLVLERYCREQDRENCTKMEWGCVFLLPAGSIVIMLCVFLYMGNHVAQLTVSLLLFGINLVTFYLLELMNQYYRAQNINDLLKAQNEAYQNQIGILQESEKRMRALRHDWKNHLYQLKMLAGEQQKEKMKRYLEDVEESLETERKFSDTGNHVIDSILNYKLGQAAHLGAQISAQLRIPEQLNITDFDLTVLFANLLDNTLEALEKTENKELKLSVWLEKDMLFLWLENTCAELDKGRDGSYRSTKEDPICHGIGMQNVKMIVDKYGGSVSFSDHENHFQVEALILNRKLEER